MGNEHGQQLQTGRCDNPSCPTCNKTITKSTFEETPKKPYEWSNKKSINKWTKNDVKDYMKSLTYTETTRNVIKNEIKGKDLLLARTPEQLAKKIGIPLEKAEGLYEIMQLQKQREMFKSNNITTKGGDNNDEKNESIDYNANFMGSNSWKGRPMINWTAYNVKSWFVSEFDGKFDLKVIKQILDAIDKKVFNGEKMMNIENGNELAQCLSIELKIANIIYSAFEKRVSSESNDDDEKSTLTDKKELYRIRKLPWRKYKFIKLSKKPDCIMNYNDDDGIDRAEMLCGHAIASDTMFYYIKSIIEKNKRAVKIICLVPNCKKEWEWKSCLRIADMTDDEIIKYNAIRSNRMSVAQFKQCPFCKVKTKRPEKLNHFRVACGRCNKGDWCFGCQQSWKKSGNTLCGNSDCTLVSSVNTILQECPMKEVGYLKNAKIPKYRACPNCLGLIEHTDACKHMDCRAKDCKTSFCFLCLAIKDKKTGWPKSCNGLDNSSHRNMCNLAPRQYFQ